MNNNELILEYTGQGLIILGWFWLIMFTIFRVENFKKRYFSILVLVYFTQGTLKVSELILIDVIPETFSGFNILSNALCIFGFIFLTSRYIKFKKSYDEKYHNSDTELHFSDDMRVAKSEKE